MIYLFTRIVRVQDAVRRERQRDDTRHASLDREALERVRRHVQVDRDERGAQRDRKSRAEFRVARVPQASPVRHHTQHTRVVVSERARDPQGLVH